MEKKALSALLLDQSGSASVEYALMAVLIAAAIVTAVTGLGVNVNKLFEAASAFP